MNADPTKYVRSSSGLITIVVIMTWLTLLMVNGNSISIVSRCRQDHIIGRVLSIGFVDVGRYMATGSAIIRATNDQDGFR